MEEKGQIVSARGGFYDVKYGNETVRCRARGKFRKEKITPLVGDYVSFRKEADLGYMEEIAPRRNSLRRPAVSNVDWVVMLAANVNPVTDPFLIDRTIASAAQQRISSILLINKCDCDSADILYDLYVSTGLPVLRISAFSGEGVEAFHEKIAGSICVFTGNSGVGKSTLLNRLDPSADVETGDVSEKLGRGRHTTRHTELYFLADGTGIIDTPGFSALDPGLVNLSDDEVLQLAFPEMAPYIHDCRFEDCTHLGEEGCAVAKAVEQGYIAKGRYQSYARMRRDWEDRDKWKKE